MVYEVAFLGGLITITREDFADKTKRGPDDKVWKAKVRRELGLSGSRPTPRHLAVDVWPYDEDLDVTSKRFVTKRSLKVAVRTLTLSLCVAVASGVLFERVGRARDRKLFPQVGQSYDVGGRSLNLNCSGDAGPTVILESGGNDPGYVWTVIQPQVAKFARVCSWDRAGAGWSDPGPYPRTCKVIAKDLHDVLRAARVTPPYVLVGYSFGGYVMRVYNGLYPDEVAGMVLVDAAHEEEGERIGVWGQGRGRKTPAWLRYPLYLGARIFAEIGVLRLRGRGRSFSAPGWTPEQVGTLVHLSGRPAAVVAGISTGIFTDENERQAHAAGGFGNKPLLVLTAGLPHRVPPQFTAEAAAYQEIWKHELQPKLARLSTRGRQLILENADHGMAFEAPDVVVGAIRQVADEVRR